MRSKRFRSQTLYPGDLVVPTWNTGTQYGMGLVLTVNIDLAATGLGKCVEVLWQNGSVPMMEFEMDIKVISEVDRD